MKRFLHLLLSVCLILVLCSALVHPVRLSAAPRRQDASLGALHVKGTHLCDSKGNIVQLRGLSTHGIAWYPDYINDALFGELHDKWGANAVRLAMYTEEYNGYCSGDSNNRSVLKQRIRDGVKYATDHDLYVIIDWHILSDGSPTTHQNEAKDFFREISKEYADHTNVLYEICNEPNGGTDWKNIKSYANAIIPVIRKNDKDAVILVGTPTWSQEVDKAAADPIKASNIMYTLHFYADTHRDDLRSRAEAAIKSGLPLFVSEFGICDASGNGKVNKAEAKKWMKLLNKYKVSYINWNISNKDESSAIIKSSCNKKRGLKSSDLSTSGKWIYRHLRKKAGLTK